MPFANIKVPEAALSGNAKNPALPSYAQARGQETGGPARELIPN